MLTVETEVDRYLTLLRNKIRERGFTQLQVQDSLGWGRSYISQLLTKQKALRVEQVLLVLNVVGVDPMEFFQELYAMSSRPGVGTLAIDSAEEARLRQELRSLRAMVHGLADLLLGERLIRADDLSVAVETAGRVSESGAQAR